MRRVTSGRSSASQDSLDLSSSRTNGDDDGRWRSHRGRQLKQEPLKLLLIPSVVVLLWIMWSSISPSSTVPVGNGRDSLKVASRLETTDNLHPQNIDQGSKTTEGQALRGDSHQSLWNSPDSSSLSSAMVILVLSHREDVRQRKVIRKTWASTTNSTVYFLVGQQHERCKDGGKSCDGQTAVLSQPDYEERDSDLIKEQDTHADLILVDRLESYHSLPYKLKFGYRWVIEASSSTSAVKWIVKVDDDMFVKPRLLQSFLQTLDDSQPTIVGRIETVHIVESSGKWADPNYKPKPDRVQPDGRPMYPRFPLGSCGHVVSRPVAQYVSTRFDELSSDYQGEDTSLGIWLDEWTDLSSSSDELVWVDLKRNVTSDGACHQPEVLMAGHDLSVQDIQMCWNMFKYFEDHPKP